METVISGNAVTIPDSRGDGIGVSLILMGKNLKLRSSQLEGQLNRPGE
jgi:hypothetical protein